MFGMKLADFFQIKVTQWCKESANEKLTMEAERLSKSVNKQNLCLRSRVTIITTINQNSCAATDKRPKKNNHTSSVAFEHVFFHKK